MIWTKCPIKTSRLHRFPETRTLIPGDVIIFEEMRSYRFTEPPRPPFGESLVVRLTENSYQEPMDFLTLVI